MFTLRDLLEDVTGKDELLLVIALFLDACYKTPVQLNNPLLPPQ